MRKRNIWVSICRIEWLTVINLQSGINIFYLVTHVETKQSIYGKAKHRLYLNRTCHISIYTHFQINIRKTGKLIHCGPVYACKTNSLTEFGFLSSDYILESAGMFTE